MAFKGITFAGQNVTPKNDGGLYQAHYGDGILWGCSMAISGDDLVIQSGEFIAGGRVCQVDGATNVDLSGRTLQTGYIQVIMNYDLSQGEGSQWYTTFVESATTTFPALTQGNINDTDTLYQRELAVVQVSGGNLTSITRTIPISEVSVLHPNGTSLHMFATDSGGYFSNTESSGHGLYLDNTGYATIYASGQPIYLRPNGAFDSSGQIVLRPNGQQEGGHSQIFQYGTKAVSATTDTQIFTFTISNAGLYVLSCYMDSNTANTGIYNNSLICANASLNKVIRSSMHNGGGSCYAGIYNIGANATVEVRGYAPTACTLRATVTASQLA